MRVAVLYRVIQGWRSPIFERLSQESGLETKIFYGPDFPGTKVVSTKKHCNYSHKELRSIKIKKKSNNGIIAMPISFTLPFNLIRYKPDVILSEGASNFFNAMTGFAYAKLFRKRFIWWSLGRLQGVKHTGWRKWMYKIIQYVELNSDAIISYSSEGKKYFEGIGVDPEKIFVAVNVIDTDLTLNRNGGRENIIDQRNKASGKQKNILFVGALTLQKKVDMLIESYHRLEKEFSDLHLIIVGDGAERKYLENLAKQIGLKSYEFTGKVIDGVDKYFIQSEIFVLPGLGGLAISESLLFGVPVIASIGDGCEKDLVRSWVNGVIDENLSVESLTQILTKLLSDENMLRSMQQEAAKTIDFDHNIFTYMESVVGAIKAK
jgi:glycosyltransferase involved in cell wall biosynthesis